MRLVPLLAYCEHSDTRGNFWSACLMRGDQIEELMVSIPPGIRSGTRLRLKGKGLEDRAGTRGDVYLRITVT